MQVNGIKIKSVYNSSTTLIWFPLPLFSNITFLKINVEMNNSWNVCVEMLQ